MKPNTKYNKEELEDMIFIKKLSYREIGRIHGVSDAYIKKICNKLGIVLEKRINHPATWKPHNRGSKQIIKCKTCNSEIFSMDKKAKYCSKECESEFKIQKKYKDFLENQEKYCRIQSMRFVKQHILKEQKNCCNICNVENIWNGKPIVFVLDHIDGDASNNLRDNLRLICPNCDSQLDTYKSKNKNSARKERYLLNYKNN
jgi:hypothetical protein